MGTPDVEQAVEDDHRRKRPLDGIRILAVEQMAALPFATQLLARLGAEVVKVEHPTTGDSGRGSHPAVADPDGRPVGATFLRNNLNKRSLAIDLKQPEGVDLVLRLAPRFDVFGENFRAGTAARLGIGYEAVRATHPAVVYLSISGFGQDAASPYRDMGAYAAIVEGMSGIYEYKRAPGRPPAANPVGALGDISSALFGAVGVLAALRHRDHTGVGQHIDVAMLDATVAMTDIVANFQSLGVEREWGSGIGIVETFAASDGHFVLQCVREHHFATLCTEIGCPSWPTTSASPPGLDGRITWTTCCARPSSRGPLTGRWPRWWASCPAPGWPAVHPRPAPRWWPTRTWPFATCWSRRFPPTTGTLSWYPVTQSSSPRYPRSPTNEFRG